jgi:hypothetical protein
MEFKPVHTITVVCAYCKKFINTKDGEGINGISHSICNVCLITVGSLSNWVPIKKSHAHAQEEIS